MRAGAPFSSAERAESADGLRHTLREADAHSARRCTAHSATRVHHAPCPGFSDWFRTETPLPGPIDNTFSASLTAAAAPLAAAAAPPRRQQHRLHPRLLRSLCLCRLRSHQRHPHRRRRCRRRRRRRLGWMRIPRAAVDKSPPFPPPSPLPPRPAVLGAYTQGRVVCAATVFSDCSAASCAVRVHLGLARPAPAPRNRPSLLRMSCVHSGRARQVRERPASRLFTSFPHFSRRTSPLGARTGARPRPGTTPVGSASRWVTLEWSLPFAK